MGQFVYDIVEFVGFQLLVNLCLFDMVCQYCGFDDRYKYLYCKWFYF